MFCEGSSKTRSQRLKLGILVLLVISIPVIGSAMAYADTDPVAETCWGVNHADIYWTDNNLGGQMFASALDTSSCTSSVHSGLDSYGYSNPNGYYVNNSAAIAKNYMADSGIFYVHSHGLPGLMLLTYNGGNNISYLTANATSDSLGYSIESLGSTLQKVRLAYFGGCLTAVTDPTFGSLIWKAVDLGAKCALGFSGERLTPQANFFDQRVLCYYESSSYNSLADSCASAVQDTRDNLGSKGGVDTYTIAGANYGDSLYLYPAKYGNQ